MAFRVDIGSALRSPRRTADGALRVDATLTRTGVFVYQNADGTKIREYRPPDEVFDAESLASFEALPVTKGHPPVFLRPDNVGQYKLGRSGDTIRRDGIHMVGGLIIEDAGLQADLEAKRLQEVSNGYECELDETPGISPEGERYDVVQRKIRGNHIAIVDAGRAGSARVRMDGVAFQISDKPVDMLSSSARKHDAARAAMTGVPAMTLEQALAALHAANEKLGATTEKLANETKRADSADQRAKDAETKATAATAKADQSEALAKVAEEKATKAATDAEKARTDATAALPGQVKSRVSLATKAIAAGIATLKIDGKDVDVCDAPERAVRCAVIAKLDGAEVPADKRENDGYIEARFDLAVERNAKSGNAFGQLAAIVNAPARTDATPGNPAEDAEAKARAKMHADSRNEWQTKEGK